MSSKTPPTVKAEGVSVDFKTKLLLFVFKHQKTRRDVGGELRRTSRKNERRSRVDLQKAASLQLSVFKSSINEEDAEKVF